MKSLLNLYTGDDWSRAQPQQSNGLDKAYVAWGRVAQKKKFALWRASLDWYKNGRFVKYWAYDTRTNTWQKIKRAGKPTAIYDKARTHDKKTGRQLLELQAKKREIAEKISMVNSPQFSELVDNKLNQAVIFNKAMPKSVFIEPGDVVKNPRGRRLVIKALGGSGGSYVLITRRKRIAVSFASIQQDFINATKAGDLRDIRICFIGDEPQYVYSRVARPGSLFTNVHMGATMEFMKLSEVTDLVKLCHELMIPLRVFKRRVMSFDFLIDVKKDQPFLVETNTMPGTNNFSDALLERFFWNVTKLTLDI